MARPVRVGLMLAAAEDFREAALPLFDEGVVEALEHSVDLGWGARGLPDWAELLLDAYGEAGRLYGHGVEFSLFSARFEERQARWLARLEREVATRRFVHFTEHFGVLTAGRFTNGTPLPHPHVPEVVAIGRDRIERLRRIVKVPLGLENLALAFGRRDVDDQPAFLEELLAPSDFLLLDVHNLYCQAFNFGLDPIALMERYPLSRVRALHVAGGRLARPSSDPEGRPFRRDGHDDHVPSEVFPLVAHALARCPSLEVIVLEHTEHALNDDGAIARFQGDFRALRALVRETGRADPGEDEPCAPAGATPRAGEPLDDSSLARVQPSGATDARATLVRLGDEGAALARVQGGPDPRAGIDATAPLEDAALARFQAALLDALYDAPDPHAAIDAIRAEAPAAWSDSLEPRAIETGMELVRRWGAREWTPTPGAMRAAVLDAPRAPLILRELPIPTPGPGQVRIRVHACGVCGTDVHLWEGRFRAPLPIVPGHEPAGVIDAVGEGVSLRAGDRVGVPWLQAGCGACERCAAGRAKYCRRQKNWITNGGAFAEHVIAEAAACVPLPEGLSFEQAAPLMCAGFTAMSGLRGAELRAGERVAVLGLGGLGHLAVQIARALGHEVIAITRARSKVRDAIAMGASEVLVAREHAGRELAAIGGADVIVSTTSDSTDTGGALFGLRDEGRLVVLGLGEGALPIDADALVNKQARVIGAMQDEPAHLSELLALAARGEVRAWIEPYRANQPQRALMRVAEGRARYRAVLIG